MIQYIITLNDNKEKSALLSVLDKLKFKPKIEERNIEISSINIKSNSKYNWIDLAGIWQDYNISLDKIREKAWPKRI